MHGFEPSLFDKLFDDSPAAALIRRHSIDDLKSAVARDLEALLNTRMVLERRLLDDYPEAACSMLGYGLTDFSSLSLHSVHDRERICSAIRDAIAANEPRLRNVEVSLETDRRLANQLMFSIAAWLMVKPTSEPVGFDAMLQPSTLRYSVANTCPIRTPG